MRLSLILAALILAMGLQAESKIALLGPFAEEKSVETLASQMGVDAHNALTPTVRLKLSVVHGGSSPESNLQAAQALADDPEVLAVVLHGEAAAAPEVLAVLSKAKLAVIAASAWATTRVAGTGTVWLSPGLESLADTAGLYARRVAKAGQVAVLDNGAPTSTAATRIFSQRFRALGGKVPSNSDWDGQDESLPGVIKSLAAHWPQVVFYAGEADAAGRLAKAMKEEKALQAADLILLPNAFDPAFFDAGRMDTRRSRALFPCMDFISTAMFMRSMGFAFPKTSPEYRAYLGYAFRKPGRWTSMLFDAVALGTRAVREASEAQVEPPSREAVHQALASIDGYRGIRGAVKFGPDRAPADDRVMVYYALNRVNKTEMHWREKDWGPPF
jgi:ABC-type branched-subunit amino acid transport system substrate-binding protein